MMQLKSILDVLGVNPGEVQFNSIRCKSVELYTSFANEPLAQLFLTPTDGFTVRFGKSLPVVSCIDALPNGGIRVQPALKPSQKF
jgi:hypothetical protein